MKPSKILHTAQMQWSTFSGGVIRPPEYQTVRQYLRVKDE